VLKEQIFVNMFNMPGADEPRESAEAPDVSKSGPKSYSVRKRSGHDVNVRAELSSGARGLRRGSGE